MHDIHHLMGELGFVLLWGMYLLLPDDRESVAHGVMMGLMGTLWALMQLDSFLEHPDRLPLLLVQLISVLFFEGSVVFLYLNRGNKEKRKTWLHPTWMGAAVVLVLSFIHLFQT